MRRFVTAAGMMRAGMLLGCPLALVLGVAADSGAIPAWSRKYRSECQLCHTAWPQLNRTGLDFRRRGYRFPGEMTPSKPAPVQPGPPAGGTARGRAAGQTPREVAATPAAYATLDCAACHQLGASGSTAAPALDEVGARLVRDAIRQAILAPAHPGAPGPGASDAEIDEIADFLAGQKAAPTARGGEPGIEQFLTANYFSAGLQTGVQDVKRTGVKQDVEFRFEQASLLYGGALNRALSPYIAVELSEGSDIRTLAQLQVTAGSASRFFYARVGQMHPIVSVGLGPLDRGKGLSVDQVVSTPVNGFRLNQKQRGLEAAYVMGGTAVRGFVLNGVTATGEGLPRGNQDTNNNKDVMVAGEHLFAGRAVNSVTALYYRGYVPTFASRQVKFDRFGLFGNVAINNAANREALRVSGGFLYGKDSVPGRTPGAKSRGALVSADALVARATYVTARYDRFRPTDRDVGNITQGFALGVINESGTWLRVGAEYQIFKRPRSITDYRVAGELFVQF